MQITKVGSKPSVRGPEDWFTGAVRIDPLFDPNNSRRSAAAIVTFEPGARTAWHTHPLGQTLIITSGCGPTHLTILEMYADTVAYKSHIKTPHFLKYKNGTRSMVKELQLIDTDPLIPALKIK